MIFKSIQETRMIPFELFTKEYISSIKYGLTLEPVVLKLFS